MDKTLFENLKIIEKEYTSFFNASQTRLVNYIALEASPSGEALFKANLIIKNGLPKEIAQKVQLILSAS
jgi:hypothetical protein